MYDSVAQSASCPRSDNEDVWRRQLISRLADVQVALWAASDGSDAKPGRVEPVIDQQSAFTEVTIDPAATFVGLSEPCPMAGSSPEGASGAAGFAVWDRIDEKRQVLDMVQRLSAENERRARKTGRALAIAGVVLFGSMAWAIVGVVLHAGAVPEVALIHAAVPLDPVRHASPAAALHDLPSSKGLQPSEPRIETAALPPARNPSADQIARLLADAGALSPFEEAARRFSEQPRHVTLAPIMTIDVSDGGLAALPVSLEAHNGALDGAVVVMTGLPAGIVPVDGRNLEHGVWQVPLAGLEHQRLNVTAAAADRFDLGLGLIRRNGELAAQGRVRVALRRPPSAVSPARQSMGEGSLGAGKSEAPSARQETGDIAGASRSASKSILPDRDEERAPAKPPRKRVRPRAEPETMPRPMSLGGKDKVEPARSRARPPTPSNERDGGAQGGFKPGSMPTWAPFNRD